MTLLRCALRGGGFFGVEKCARPDINKGMTGVQKTLKEMQKEFLKEILKEVDCLARQRDYYMNAAVVRVYSDRVINFLMKDRGIDAWEMLRKAYNELLLAKRASSPQMFYEALCAFDLACFAYSLWVYFGHFEEGEQEIVNHIWHERRYFLPHLADVFVASFNYIVHLRDGWKPGEAFYCVLKSANYVYETFGQCFMYNDKLVGHLIGSEALSKLKDLFRAYARDYNISSAAEKKRL